MAWTCPQCQRRFARVGQSHDCAPALELGEYFATGPIHERPIFDAVMAAIGDVGPIHIEPVSVGIFLKRARTFAELRPKQRWVALSFSLPHQVAHPTIVRRVERYGNRYFHVANLAGPEDFDEQLRDWVIEAYLDTPE